MKRIYNALNLPDAHIVAGLLEQAGIRVRIFNANAVGALGELPVDAAGPQVWVERDADAARGRGIIEAHQRSSASALLHACVHCGEENPEAFEICWNCGKLVDR